MRPRTNIAIILLVAVVAGLVAAVSAQGDKVVFPTAYASGMRYWVQDRPNANNPANSQVREYYTSAAAIDAAKKGSRCRAARSSPWCSTACSSMPMASRRRAQAAAA